MGGRSWRLLFFIILTAGIVGYQLVIAIHPTFSLIDCLFFLLLGAIASLLATPSAHKLLLQLASISRKPGYSMALICLGALSAVSGTPFFFLSLLIGFSLVADWLPVLIPDEHDDVEEVVDDEIAETAIEETQPKQMLTTGDVFKAMVLLVKEPVHDCCCRYCKSNSQALVEHPYLRQYHEPGCKVPELYEALSTLPRQTSQSV